MTPGPCQPCGVQLASALRLVVVCWIGAMQVGCCPCECWKLAVDPCLLFTVHDAPPHIARSGYAAGEVPLPDPPVTRDLVQDYKADRTGGVSATKAFQDAINAMPPYSVLRVPAGRYLLTGTVNIKKSITIRGDGSDDTTLIMGNGVSSYAFLYWGRNLRAGGTPTRLVNVDALAKRGATLIKVCQCMRLLQQEAMHVARTLVCNGPSHHSSLAPTLYQVADSSVLRSYVGRWVVLSQGSATGSPFYRGMREGRT